MRNSYLVSSAYRCSWLQILFLFIAFSYGLPRCWAQYQHTDKDPFVKLNSAFRLAYADARGEALRMTGPVVISRHHFLVLHYRGERYEGAKIDETYDQLKTVAHAPLAIYVMLAGHVDGSLAQAECDRIRAFCDLMNPVHTALDSCALRSHQKERQRRLLDCCKSFLDGVLADGKCGRSDLTRFCRECAPDLMQNTSEAALVRLEAYHRQMCAWRKVIEAEDWDRLRVVVTGAQMPRPGNLAVQYFARLLGESGEGKRIIYAEALFDETSALNLLGTHRLDASAAQAFFGDRSRLNRDLLADATPTALDTLDWSKLLPSASPD